MKILLIEDNLAIQTSLTRTFERRGMQVVACGDGARALDRWHASQPDVVLLDLSLPGLDGLEVLTQARAAGLAAPVLILTARGTVGDRVIGLDSGADDYLAKPFDLDELEARVRALARRGGAARRGLDAGDRGTERGTDRGTERGTERGTDRGFEHTAEFCGLRSDPASGAVYFRGAPLELAPRESALLRAVLARPGRAVAKERLFELVFPGEPQLQAEAIEVVAYRLRKKLAPTGAQLVTLRGLGYLLKAAP